ncbi:hypothetical protein FDECE_12525 [Fusarium decemcellulare]|nr:hypothetical protein FDECE_12525 [Fusarium decemcellulare]
MGTEYVTLNHDLLGKFTGIKSHLPVTQYLGVKYASIGGRFEESTLFQHATEEATKFGPACPQISNALQIEQEVLIQKALPLTGERPSQSDTECLNLNITVPQDFAGEKQLPVLVWIHGGGFQFGANFWPQTDMSKLVTLGQKSRKPFIGISINYRTGVFGFLASSELKEFGSSGNLGIKDQINAFLWIQKFISGFGGDPENVTAMGESCGGVSATLLLHYKEPLFCRVISMSGHALLMAPVPLVEADAAYANVVASLGFSELSPKERVAKLRAVSFETITEKVPFSVPNRPVIDHVLFTGPVTAVDVQNAAAVGMIPGKAWCQGLMIGDCQADGYIMSGALQGSELDIARQFIGSLNKSLFGHPDLVATILADYKISEGDEGKDAFHKIIALLTDVGFHAPTSIALKGWPRNKDRYGYHFNAANPFPGPLNGKASHVLDVAYAFQNYNQFLSEADVDVAEDFASAIINFVKNGSPGWAAWSQKDPKNFMVFGQTTDKEATFGCEGKLQGRPFVPKVLATYDYELLWGALQKFLAGM